MDKHEFREIQKKLKLTNEGVSEAMDVELFTVQQWASGTWPIPNAMTKFLRTLVMLSKKVSTLDAYTRGHDAGYGAGYDAARLNRDKGYTDGYKEGQVEGYKRGRSGGYSKGNNDGYAAGKQKGYEYGLEDSSDTRKQEYTAGYIAAMKAVGIF